MDESLGDVGGGGRFGEQISLVWMRRLSVSSRLGSCRSCIDHSGWCVVRLCRSGTGVMIYYEQRQLDAVTVFFELAA